MKKKKTPKVVVVTFTSVFLGLALASADEIKPKFTPPTPYTQVNDSVIRVSGKVTEVSPNIFTLDYGKGAILVEMDDFDNFPETYALQKGDEVVVTGTVDADMGEQRSIEAGSVFIKNVNTYFYASSIDEEDFLPYIYGSTDYPSVGYRGQITNIGSESFTMKTSEGKEVNVIFDELGYNPFKMGGNQELALGDQVWVAGNYDPDLLTDDDLTASTIITLRKTESS